MRRLIEEHGAKIVDAWVARVVVACPPALARLCASGSDPFRNPVAATLANGLRGAFDWIRSTDDVASLTPVLLPLARLAVLWDLRAEDLAGFFALLEPAVHDANGDHERPGHGAIWTALEGRANAAASHLCALHAASDRVLRGIGERETERRRYVIDRIVARRLERA